MDALAAPAAHPDNLLTVAGQSRRQMQMHTELCRRYAAVLRVNVRAVRLMTS
jgi:hypothetical protein